MTNGRPNYISEGATINIYDFRPSSNASEYQIPREFSVSFIVFQYCEIHSQHNYSANSGIILGRINKINDVILCRVLIAFRQK